MLAKNNTGLIVTDVQGKLAQLVDDSETVIAGGGNTERNSSFA